MKEDSVIKDRNKYIGGSDVPIIMGISPFKTRYDLLLEKAQIKENDFEGNEYTEYGNILEPIIREYVNETLYSKDRFKDDVLIKGNRRANFDGINKTAVLEIKTTSQIHENVNDYKVYLAQLLFYMDLAGREKGILAVYERPEDFNTDFDEKRLTLHFIDKDNYKDFIKEINEAIDRFLEDLEKLKANPFLTEEDLLPVDITKKANAILKLETQVVEAKKIIASYEEEKEKLRLEMEEKGIKKWETPNGVKFTLINGTEDTEVEALDEKTFKEEQEELYKKYLVKKIKKGRKGSLRITLPK